MAITETQRTRQTFVHPIPHDVRSLIVEALEFVMHLLLLACPGLRLCAARPFLSVHAWTRLRPPTATFQHIQALSP